MNLISPVSTGTTSSRETPGASSVTEQRRGSQEEAPASVPHSGGNDGAVKNKPGPQTGVTKSGMFLTKSFWNFLLIPSSSIVNN